MAEKPKPSRAPTSRPRKLAGQRPHPEPAAAAPPVEPEPPEEPEHDEAPPRPEPPEAEPEWPDETPPPASRRTSIVLAVVIVVLLAIAGWEAWYVWGKDDAVVSAQRPVVVSPLTASSVVDTAAKAATKIISASYEDYDAQIDEAAETMTDGFADQFRQTKEDIRKEFIDSKTKVAADVAEQGVVTASPEQVVALVFLTQTTERPKQPLDVVQYRVEVTMVHTSSGWLVADLDTL
jgi:Mce-associated membrane protein